MTAPSPTPAPGVGALAESAPRDAVLTALAAEHAAIWAHGLASAFLPAGDADALTEAARSHRERRDAVLALLESANVASVPAAAAYSTPAPVTDATSAARLLVVAEEDVAVAWRAVCERTTGADGTLRGLAVDAVSATARTAVRWRRSAGVDPVVPVLPGTPGP